MKNFRLFGFSISDEEEKELNRKVDAAKTWVDKYYPTPKQDTYKPLFKINSTVRDDIWFTTLDSIKYAGITKYRLDELAKAGKIIRRKGIHGEWLYHGRTLDNWVRSQGKRLNYNPENQ